MQRVFGVETDLFGLGQPKPEPAAVSAIITNELGLPYPKIKVAATVAQTDTLIDAGETDDQGRIRFDVPSSGLLMRITPQLGFFARAVPESATVASLPTTGILPVGKWGWDNSVKFTIYPKKAEDFMTTTTVVGAGLIVLGLWYFYFRE